MKTPYLTALSITVLFLTCSQLPAQEPVNGETLKDLVTTNEQYLPSTNSIPPADAVILWNGRDLTGWKPVFTNEGLDISKLWFASNRVLHLAGKPNGYLCTDKQYSNYHLHVEWRWEQTNGNSGVFVFVKPLQNEVWPQAVECQLKSGNAGELLGLGGMSFDAPFVRGRNRAVVTNSSENPIGGWNSYDIYCRGNSVEAWVNGVKKNHAGKVAVDGGSIALQFEGRPIEFRNIWLSPL